MKEKGLRIFLAELSGSTTERLVETQEQKPQAGDRRQPHTEREREREEKIDKEIGDAGDWRCWRLEMLEISYF